MPSSIDAKRLAGERALVRRRAVAKVRRTVVLVSVTVFIALFSTIFIQLAAGRDPALTASTTTSTSSTSSATGSSSEDSSSLDDASSDDSSSEDSSTDDSSVDDAVSEDSSSDDSADQPSAVTTTQS